MCVVFVCDWMGQLFQLSVRLLLPLPHCFRVHRQLVTVFGFKPPPVVRRPAPPSKGALSSKPEGAEQSSREAFSVRERALSELDYIMVDVDSSPVAEETRNSTPIESDGVDRPTA